MKKKKKKKNGENLSTYKFLLNYSTYEATSIVIILFQVYAHL